MRKTKRRFAKSKETKNLVREFFNYTGIDFNKLFKTKLSIEIATINESDLYIINKMPIIARTKGVLYPTLKASEILGFFSNAIINVGAVSHVCNGADIMAPGIVQYKGEFNENDIVVIHEERFKKALAIGKALYDLKSAIEMKKGKIFKNLHYVGDTLWINLKHL